MTQIALETSGINAEIDTIGAQLYTLRDAEGRNLLWNGDPAIWKSRAPILFPIVGNLNGGEYRHAGKTYQLPRHGFARTRRFTLARVASDRALFRLTADDESRAVYPFDFVLEILFALADRTLSITATISNVGLEEMPASFGFHPAFCWPLPYGADRSEHSIHFEKEETASVRYLDEEGLILPECFPTPIAGRTLALTDALFAHDAIIMDRIASKSVVYGARRGRKLEIAFPNTPHLGLWTKPGAGYVCVEPWHGYADPQGYCGTLEGKPGINRIAPGQWRTCTMSVTLLEESCIS